MSITITRYPYCRFARVDNPATLKIPPAAMMLRLRGAADIHGPSSDSPLSVIGEFPKATANEETPESSLLWAILEATVYDLALVSREFLALRGTREEYPDLISARRHVKVGALWYAKYIGLDADWIRRQLRECGYLPDVQWIEADSDLEDVDKCAAAWRKTQTVETDARF